MALGAKPGSEKKKQISLTSFFSPKATNSGSLPQSSPLQRTLAAPSRKRSLAQDDDKGNQLPDRTSKRAKSVPEEENAEPVTVTPSLAGSSQAERYRYKESNETNATEGEEDNDAATKKKNEDLHRRFVKKLGHPDALSWRSRFNSEAATVEDGADGDDDEDEDPNPAKSKKKGAKTGKLTPMEIQFLDIKRKHMDTVLIVEVGYKFKFFGEDARIAAKELSIVCIPGKMRFDEHPSEAHLDRFASASIPVHRLPVHAKRLVAAGHKVGVVRQIETAALKKVGDNRNAPFTRKLTNLYTKGTYIDENGDLEQQPQASSPSGGYLLCITESSTKGSGTDEKVQVGILAVQPATGDIIHDTFEDGFMRSEIETRLLHISPCEFLIVGELSKSSEKLVQHLSGSSTNVFGDRSRMERISKSSTVGAEAYSHVTQFYAEMVKESKSEESGRLLDKVLKLAEPVTICLSAMIKHLTEYGLEHVLDLTKYFENFTARSHMVLNGTTLESLEVYRNSTDHSEKGSLFWAIDKTQTRFGQRVLRKWIGRPLLDRDQLGRRVSAVQELHDKQSSSAVDSLERLLSTTKADLERSLIRIYYGKCTRPELVSVLQTLQKIAGHYTGIKSPADVPFDSPIIAESICALPQILDLVVSYLERINLVAAQKDDKYTFFRDEYQTETINDHQLGIAHVDHELDQHRAIAAAKIHKKTVEYRTVSGIDYLIEVSNHEVKNVPASWAKISGTKSVSRFHTPEVVRFIAERDQHREALAAACDAAFKDLLVEISGQYQPLRDAVVSLATLDCLLSLSRVAAQPGYTKPTILPASARATISISQGRHPIAEQTLDAGYIPFSTSLGHPSPLAHLITGPNMGGKSSFVRALALIVLLAQVGSYVPADSCTLTLCDAIFTRTGANDNLFTGESTFMVEVSETARILRSATPRSLVILDELGRGTSTHDGAAIAQAVLHHVVKDVNCLTLFITHYQSLARMADSLSDLTNVHMKFTAQANEDGEEVITFLYEVEPGVAHRSYGLNVARLANIPKKVIDVAAKKSKELERDLGLRQLQGTCRLLQNVLEQNGGSSIDHLVASIENL